VKLFIKSSDARGLKDDTWRKYYLSSDCLTILLVGGGIQKRSGSPKPEGKAA